MRTTITLADDVYEAARALATQRGRSLGDIVTELVRRGLRPERIGEESGLPVFDVARDAEIIPTDRAAQLLADEGLD